MIIRWRRTCLLLLRSIPTLYEVSRPEGVTLARDNRSVPPKHCRSGRMDRRQQGHALKSDNRIPDIIPFDLVVPLAPQVHTAGRRPNGRSTIRCLETITFRLLRHLTSWNRLSKIQTSSRLSPQSGKILKRLPAVTTGRLEMSAVGSTVRKRPGKQYACNSFREHIALKESVPYKSQKPMERNALWVLPLYRTALCRP